MSDNTAATAQILHVDPETGRTLLQVGDQLFEAVPVVDPAATLDPDKLDRVALAHRYAELDQIGNHRSRSAAMTAAQWVEWTLLNHLTWSGQPVVAGELWNWIVQDRNFTTGGRDYLEYQLIFTVTWNTLAANTPAPTPVA